MDVAMVREVLMWCAVINIGLLLFSFVVLAAGRDFVYGIHSKLFPMSREAFTVSIYGFLGVYKILIFVFNVVPYVALSLVGG